MGIKQSLFLIGHLYLSCVWLGVGFKNKNPKGMWSKEIGLRAKILVTILGSKSHIIPPGGGTDMSIQ